MFTEQDVIYKQTRAEAIADHVLIDVRPPIYENVRLKAMLAHNDSICFTDSLLNDLIHMEDEKTSIQDLIQQVVKDMIFLVLQNKANDVQPSNLLEFQTILSNSTKTFKLKLVSMTHYEKEFQGKDLAKCITIMNPGED